MNCKYILPFFLFLHIVFSGCGHKSEEKIVPAIDTIPTLVMQVQKCSRLYTSEYQLRKIVIFSDSLSLSGSFFRKNFTLNIPAGRRKIAIPITASAKAYVDFEKFSEKNIKKHGDKLEIVLPDPEIAMTGTEIDYEAIKKKVSILRHNFTDEEITHIQQQGRIDMIKSLPDLGLIENARLSAVRQLIPLFEQMGYKQQNITVTFRKKYDLNDLRRLIRKME